MLVLQEGVIEMDERNANPQESAPSRILLVEDLALHRRVIPVRLGVLGRELSSVANAADAESRMREALPDLVLLDVILPGKDGFTFCREIKADPTLADVAVMVLSDLKGEAFERSLEAGADDYLPKSMDDVVLRIRTRLHLNLREHRRRLGRNRSTVDPLPSSILLITPSPVLKSQLEAQASQDGHSIRTIKGLEDLDQLASTDEILIIDMTRDPSGLHEALMTLRMNPETQNIAVLLLCEKIAFPLLPAIENMVDDVLWKPLNAKVTRFRLRYLKELAHLIRA
jgi:CheY-like chemotaxis protein